MFIQSAQRRAAPDPSQAIPPARGPTGDTVVAIVVSVLGFLIICALAVIAYVLWKKTRRDRGAYMPTPTRPTTPPLTRTRPIDRPSVTQPRAATALSAEPETERSFAEPEPASAPATDSRGRPVLRVVTRSPSAASRLSTEVVVHHADDGGWWQVDWPLMRERPKQMRAPRKRSERNAEGRRVVKELIPPMYDPSWSRENLEIMEERQVLPASHIP